MGEYFCIVPWNLFSPSAHPLYPSLCNSIYNLALSWCQWNLWCYSYSYRLIICQRQQYVRAERSTVRTCLTERFRRENRTRSRHTKSMKRSTACLLGYNQHYGTSAARSCLAERSSLGGKENTVNCMPAVVQASQTTPLVFTSNTLDSSDINPSGFALRIYAWTALCITSKHLWEWFIYYLTCQQGRNQFFVILVNAIGCGLGVF